MKILCALCSLFLLLSFIPVQASEKENTYDRVMRTGTIRCGYSTWPPILVKDSNTGDLSGYAREIMEEIGKRLSLKVLWAEDAGWGGVVQGLDSGRYDMICSAMYINAARARVIDFTEPLVLSPFYLISRADDKRFDKDFSKLNNKAYKIAILEGEQTSITQRQLFPDAKADLLAPSSDGSLLLKEVETKKADVTMTEMANFVDYNISNPGKVKIVDRKKPLNVIPAGFGLPRNDLAFKRMIDLTLNEMRFDGTLDRIINKYQVGRYEGIYLPLPKLYDLPK